MRKILEQIGLLVLSCLPFNLWAQAEDGLAPEKPEVLSAELVYNYFDYDIVLFDEDAYFLLTMDMKAHKHFVITHWIDWTDFGPTLEYMPIEGKDYTVVQGDTVVFKFERPDWGARWRFWVWNDYGKNSSDIICLNDYITDESIREAFETFVGIESPARDEEVEAEVFTTGGQRVGNCLMRNGRADLTGLPRGIYVVKSGGKARKVAVK